MYRTVISQNYSDPAHKMIDNNRYGKGIPDRLYKVVCQVFLYVLLKNVQKYRKIYKKLVESYCENTEQKMR